MGKSKGKRRSGQTDTISSHTLIKNDRDIKSFLREKIGEEKSKGNISETEDLILNMATDRNTTPYFLKYLAKSEDYRENELVQMALLTNKNLNPELKFKAYKNIDKIDKELAASLLFGLRNDESINSLVKIEYGPALRALKHLYRGIAESDNKEMKVEILKDKNVDKNTVYKLLREDQPEEVRAQAAVHPRVSYIKLLTLCFDESTKVRESIAQKSRDPVILTLLSLRVDSNVRAATAMNQNTPRPLLFLVHGTDSSAEVRMALANNKRRHGRFILHRLISNSTEPEVLMSIMGREEISRFMLGRIAWRIRDIDDKRSKEILLREISKHPKGTKRIYSIAFGNRLRFREYAGRVINKAGESASRIIKKVRESKNSKGK